VSRNAKFEDISLGAYASQGFDFGDPVCTDTTDDRYGGFGSMNGLVVKGNVLDSPNNTRLSFSSYPNNDPEPFADPDPSDPNNAYSAYPLQLTYRITDTVIDQVGVSAINNAGVRRRMRVMTSRASVCLRRRCRTRSRCQPMAARFMCGCTTARPGTTSPTN